MFQNIRLKPDVHKINSNPTSEKGVRVYANQLQLKNFAIRLRDHLYCKKSVPTANAIFVAHCLREVASSMQRFVGEVEDI